jgi:hypothetical protein
MKWLKLLLWTAAMELLIIGMLWVMLGPPTWNGWGW